MLHMIYISTSLSSLSLSIYVYIYIYIYIYIHTHAHNAAYVDMLKRKSSAEDLRPPLPVPTPNLTTKLIYTRIA